MKLIKSDVQFDRGKVRYNFSIIHNLPNKSGMSFNHALDNWLARTKEFTASSLCKYIMSKDESFVAMTMKTFNRLNNESNLAN